MITNPLLDHPWVTPAGLAILVVLGPLVGMRLVPKPRLAWLLTGVSLLGVAALTLSPVDRQPFAVCTVQWVLPTLGRVELFANVALFVAPALQAVAPGIGRSCDTTDWLCNTIGAAVGALLARTALSLARRSSARSLAGEQPAGVPPS